MCLLEEWQNLILILRSKLIFSVVCLNYCRCRCVVESLLAPDVTQLHGNDVAGAKVFPNSVLPKVPVTIPATFNIEKELPRVFSVCALTCSMSRDTESPPDRNEEEEGEEEVNVESAGDDGVLLYIEDNSFADMFNPEVLPSLANATVEQLYGSAEWS